MLVLSRKPMQQIYIGDSVVVTVLEVRGKKARIGIDAPKEIPVWRSELRDPVEADFAKRGMTVNQSQRDGPKSAQGAAQRNPV